MTDIKRNSENTI